ncbi:hypothetical protein AOC36_01965 [Erysipelothrix larvae]|uniref:Major facilitator superfamily (MFS) profile domain-containing protein n=1 Tax=Erysipelothrix larvae TaxID=1514105 RepID=A0A120JTG2_9FIRM|nr:MFS transporter [Erysipelothrix larvae]AMC92791.1 hypothetical protein AOC36_01965 [Erysipelothrix larvae]
MIYAYYLFMFFGLGVFLPFLSVYFVETTPMRASQVTLMMAFVPVIQFFSTNFFAFLSDKTRKYKPILVFATLCTIASCLFLGYVARFELVALVIVAYAIFAFFMQSPSQLSENFVLQYSNERNIPYGRLRLFGSLGYAIAGYFGGALTQEFGLSIIFIVYAICLSTPLVLVNKFPDIKEVEREQKEDIPKDSNIYKRLFANKRFVVLLSVSFFILASISVIATFFGIYITEHVGLDLKFLGLTTLISAGTEIPMMFFSNKLIDKFGAYKILAVAAILNAMRFIVYLMFPVRSVILLVTATHGIGYGSAFTSIIHLIDKEIPANIRASALSLNTTLAMGIGTSVITILGSTFFNARTVFGLLAFFEVCGLAICLYLINTTKEDETLVI